MAVVKYSGNGVVASTDFVPVKWVGKTKSGHAVTISMTKAINKSNIDLTFAEKDDVVAKLTFTSVYSNTDTASSSDAEPWEIEVADGVTAGAGEIVLGAGIFYINNNAIALTRGGGKFTVTREFRNINADGDRGAVEGRVVMDGSEATLEMNALTMLTTFDSMFPAITKS